MRETPPPLSRSRHTAWFTATERPSLSVEVLSLGDITVKRIEILDGLRGYFLLFMLLNHIVFEGGLWLQEINLDQVMFVEDAQGFVFLSGLLIGLLQTRRYLRHGAAAMRASVWRRAGELYLYTLGLIALLLVAHVLLPGAGEAYYNWMGAAGVHDLTRVAGLLTLVFQPTFMDILPMYILLLLVAPPLVQLVAEGRWPLVMTLSLLVWMAAQVGVGTAIGIPLNQLFLASDGQGLRGSFNPLGWQLVFLSGLVVGGLMARGGINWRAMFRPEQTTLPLMCLIVLVFFLPMRVITAHGMIRYEFLGPFESMALRPNFGPVYLVNMVGAAGLLTWLLIAGPDSPHRWIAALSRGVNGLFMLRPLRLLGRHSLQTYAWHVVLVYGLHYVDAMTGPFDQSGRTLLAGICVALLPLPALWREKGPEIRRRARMLVG